VSLDWYAEIRYRVAHEHRQVVFGDLKTRFPLPLADRPSQNAQFRGPDGSGLQPQNNLIETKRVPVDGSKSIHKCQAGNGKQEASWKVGY
jgi:hypothetical protein